jgi:competence protein ComEC
MTKIPRHGSATGSSAEFVAASRPRLALLSAAARSRTEAKRDEILERYRSVGAEVLTTHEDGAVIIETDGKSLSYSGYKSGRAGKLEL